MKRFLSLGMAFLLTLSMVAGCASAEAASNSGNNNTVQFDFETDDSGFIPIFADYPNIEGVEDFYEFRHEYGKIPIDGAGKGIFISGSNHSDDLFMGYVKVLEGFSPGRAYQFDVTFKLATDVDGGLMGVGGAPGESVTVKCGITPTEPLSVSNAPGECYRMNIDKGVQSNDGKDMVIVGDMTKTENNRPGEYEFKEFQVELETVANIRGEIYLIIGTDSGFEATTSYYLDDISVQWKDTEQPAVTRAQAAQMLFHAADRASADPTACSFRDVAVDAPYAEAVAWVQQNGYLSGYGNVLFGPENNMTVEQAMVMIYRFFGKPTADPVALSSIQGGDQVSVWAKDAVAWTLTSEILKTTSSISPQAPITLEELTYSIGQIVVAC